MISITNSKAYSTSFRRQTGKVFGNNDAIASWLCDKAALRFLKNSSVEVIMVNGLYGWYLTLKKPDVPLINIFHGCYGGVANYVLKSDRKLLFHYYKDYLGFIEHLSALGKVVVSVSKFVHDLLKNYYELNSIIIPNAINTDIFKPMEKTKARKVLSLPLNRKIGIFVGAPLYSKGFDILLKTAKMKPDVLFIVVSPNSKSSWITSNILQFSKISHMNMPIFYSAADFLIFPSRFEGCSLSILEAMACGIPVITSATGSFYGLSGLQMFGYVLPLNADIQQYTLAISRVSTIQHFNPRTYVNENHSLKEFQLSYQNIVKHAITSFSF